MMKHLGDITKLDGAAIEPVWCVTGGSPCQDLSIAGKRAGLAGARSGLFMEQIRVIKEMRKHDKQLGWAGELIRPRYMVWENVPGALSSNKGRDFAAVLEETIRLVEPEAPGIEVPAKGWPTWGGYRDVDGRWSVAWRVHDAQYWGVPQRRRRIALVADFGGDTAHEILFERAGVSGDLTPCGEAGERPAGDAEAGAAYAVRIRGGCDGGGKGALIQTEKSGTLGTGNDQTIFQGAAYGICSYASNSMKSSNPHSGVYVADTSRTLDLNGGNPACNQGGIAVVSYALQGSMIGREDKNDPQGDGINEDVSFTLNTVDRQAVASCAGFKLGAATSAHSVGYEVEKSPTLTAMSGGNKPAVLNQVPLTYPMQGFGDYRRADVASACKQRDYKDSTDLVVGLDGECNSYTEQYGTLRAHTSGDAEETVMSRCVVRRLTPLECERLQGFPDGWTDIGDYTDSTGKKRKTSDSARYKALGNSIALPFWRWMFGRMAAYLPEGATLGSLFDGIGGFPLCWEDVHGIGTAIWASEIEEFPIAVTKKRFGGENMIHYTLNVEPPVEPPEYTCPRCPVCDAETDKLLRDRWGNIVGCPECVKEVDAWTL